MTDSQTPEENSSDADDSLDGPPLYELVMQWAEYIKAQPPEVWGPQQNAVVNGQIESAQAVDVSAEDRKRIREFADETLRAEGESNEEGEDGE